MPPKQLIISCPLRCRPRVPVCWSVKSPACFKYFSSINVCTLEKFALPLNRLLFSALLLLSATALWSQPNYWQQAARYEMEIDFDVTKHQFTGQQRLTYQNNSPDTLKRAFYHLYFNAFQPGSMMDVRSQTIADADPRVGSRIGALGPDEIGYQKVNSLTMNGTPAKYTVEETVLVVDLPEPILPGAQAVFEMEFAAQVPVQIRRSGRDNAEGIAYSMAQWYPKMAEYDRMGWHSNPYVGREFYGIWGDFDVKISIDKDYTVGGTGYLQNPAEIGHGYTEEAVEPEGEKITYHFFAPRVHDFMWAADPDYTHTTFERENGMVMHFFFQENERTKDNWAALPGIMDKAFAYINAHYGEYPYDQYSFIQGGDGGMEYPMATLITGERNLNSLVGVSVHELMHSWYQMVLGTNESLYAWMDEGFTSWASAEVMNHLRSIGALPGEPMPNPQMNSILGLAGFRQSGRQEPLSVHSDHFDTNAAYSVAAYVKGAVFLEQLKAIIGTEAFDRTLKRYFATWKFKHPTPNDFIRIAEKESGLELDWYKEYMVYTTKAPDYAVSEVSSEGGKATITLQKLGSMPMPLDVRVTLDNGTETWYNIPLVLMRGEKPRPAGVENYVVLPDWSWTNPKYSFTIDVPADRVESVVIDPGVHMLDDNRENNTWQKSDN
jgi:hypothetical protein